jgi:hypothetical protein
VTTTPQEHLALIRRILGANYLELQLARLQVDEQPEDGTVVKVVVVERGVRAEVEGKGVGIVDALYAGLLARYASEYQSLKSIHLVGFSVAPQLDTKTGDSGVDAVGTVTFEVENSEGRLFRFSDTSRSVTTSICRAVLAVFQYFVNAERAFLTLDHARKDALERGREDLVARYTAEMAEVVESTSYAEVIELIRRGLK